MANDYFQFKQFRISQAKAAMKVCTDSCLFGAWAATVWKKRVLVADSLLDIGTGTGLLALMLAQELPANITAIDIDEAAVAQAKENAQQSPWSARIDVFQQDLLNYQAIDPFRFIVCNPPFYEASLPSPHDKINLARHDTGLRMEDLLAFISNNLTAAGEAALLWPANRLEEMVNALPLQQLHLTNLQLVQNNIEQEPFRAMLLISKQPVPIVERNTIVIRTSSNAYSPAFSQLLAPYYLNW
jgi:tRNA1Val (adenine37-N6)-methyltransferase